MNKVHFWIWLLIIVIGLGLGIWVLGFWLGGCASTQELPTTTSITTTTTTTTTSTSSSTTTSTTTTTLFTVWTGTKQFGTPKLDRANGITVDSSGNVYVAGTTAGSLEGNSNAGGRDFFVVKYDSAGNRKWIRQRGTADQDEANGVAVDANGNVYVAGIWYWQSPDGTLRTEGAVLLDKYDSNGNWKWEVNSITVGGSFECNDIRGIAVDANNNTYVTGTISVIHNINGQISYGDNDAYVAKYDANGNKQWINVIGSLPISPGQYVDDWLNAIAVDTAGKVYVTGNTGGFTLEGNVSGSGDSFVVKYNSLGIREFARQFANDSGYGDMAQGIAVGTDGNIYVAGGTGGVFPGNTSQGDMDYFLAKFTSSGTIETVKQSGSGQEDRSNGVAIKATDGIYSAGRTRHVESGFGNFSDILLIKYNTSIIEQWKREIGNSNDDDEAMGVAVDTNGNIFITGFTNGSLNGNVNQGDYDAFVIKYNSSGVKQ